MIKREGTVPRKMLFLGIALTLPWLINDWRLGQSKSTVQAQRLAPQVQAEVHSERSAQARAEDWLTARGIQADQVITFPGAPTVKVVRYCESDAQFAAQAPYRWSVWPITAPEGGDILR